MSDWLDKCHFGDCRDTMRRMIADGVKVQTIVTSPPYWGLRDYGVDGQIGMEPTLREFIAGMVEVFRLCREVLADDGTMWVNMGDSYLENKQLAVQPHRLAIALQEPYYAGKIKREADRAWLGAMIDGEGCFFIHKRKAGSSAHSRFTRADGTEANYVRKVDTYGVGLEICNTQKAIIDRVQEIAGFGTMTTQSPAQNNRRKILAREVYPHLVGKRQQARLIYNCPSSGEAGATAHQAMMDLHNGIATDVDYPAPPTLFEPGFYLRQDIVWAKKNPMPESIKDRCTKSHEYLFFLSKREQYFSNFEAIREPASFGATPSGVGFGHGFDSPERIQQRGRSKRDSFKRDNSKRASAIPGQSVGTHRPDRVESDWDVLTRNKRSVWTIPTQAYAAAHFATFPETLVEPCVMAGSRPGDIVFDPFFGSGTTGSVAQRLGRHWIGCELNSAYEPLQRDRLRQPGLALEIA